MEGGAASRMTVEPREMTLNSSPAVAANAEGEEIEVLETTDVNPMAPEDVSNNPPSPLLLQICSNHHNSFSNSLTADVKCAFLLL